MVASRLGQVEGQTDLDPGVWVEMAEPVIEYKDRRKPTSISLIEAKIRRKEVQARSMVKRLETALVRCGYTRNCQYRDIPGHVGTRAVILIWSNGQIRLPADRGKPLLTVDDLSGHQLLKLAQHLPYLVDEPEHECDTFGLHTHRDQDTGVLILG